MEYTQGQNLPGRRTREERRSLSETLADGTSKFFSSMVAKKNGLFSDLSSKIENTFSAKTETVSNNTGSDGSASPPNTPSVPQTPPPRPPPPKRLPSMGSSREKENVMKRMSSMPAYSRTESRPEAEDFRFNPPNSSRPVESGGTAGVMTAASKVQDEHYSVSGMNISFDEPIYSQREANSTIPGGTAMPVSNKAKMRYEDSTATTAQAPTRSESTPKDAPGSTSDSVGSGDVNARTPRSQVSTSGQSSPVPVPKPAPRTQKQPVNVSPTEKPEASYEHYQSRDDQQYQADYDRGMPRHKSSSSGEWSDKGQGSVDSGRSNNEKYSDGSNSGGESRTRKKAPKFTSSTRRSSTVDEMLFDDYVDPEVDTVIATDTPPENLISFEPDIDLSRSDSSGIDGNGRGLNQGTSVDSSDVEFGGTLVHRSGSMGSEKSWSSNYSVDSQPDDVTLECMEFMKSFVDKVFHNSEEISQTEKAKFGELCQYFPGRLWFSRYVNSQRVHNKKVTEAIFFRLMQYFAVFLFECNEAEDYSPAKTLMNMCFTFFYEAPTPHGQSEKVFLYTYMRDQPIWQSLRFWNAAFFDAVQCERSRRPMPTNSAENETVTDDRQFQENITFGQLGTFACNMRSFGLSRELCLEFLRKQSTIANLRKDQVKLLRDNIDRVRDE